MKYNLQMTAGSTETAIIQNITSAIEGSLETGKCFKYFNCLFGN